MATVSSRSHGGLPKPQRVVNPFDSDDDVPTTSSRSHVSNSSSSSAPPSTRYTNPFDDDVKSNGRTKSKAVAADHRVAKSSNPFDDDDSPAKPSRQVAKGNKIKTNSSQSSTSNDAANPFSDDYEVTSKPKSRADSILDNGSLFDDEEVPSSKPVKERKSSTRAFAAKIVEGGSRMKESASNSLSNVKLPSMSSASAPKGYAADEKSEHKRFGKSKQQSKELLGEPEPGYISTQYNYFSQSDQSRFSSQSVEELQQYAVTKSQDTTSSIRNAIRIAEDTKGIATTTLETLHTQGDQIRRTHETAVRVDEELGRGEKLLGSLGGMFTMTWKPKKAHKITGPQVDPDQYKRKNNLGERDALGLNGGESAARPRPQLSELSNAQVQLEMEKNTQDEGLSDLSNILGQLKGMTLEMGHEIERQNGDLDRMHDDVHELNARVKGANNRTRHLLGR